MWRSVIMFLQAHPYGSLATIVVVNLWGLLSILNALRFGLGLENASTDFQRTFRNWSNSGRQDYRAYEKLIGNSAKIQNEMGDYGLMARLVDRGTEYRNYPVILNALPTIKNLHVNNKFGMETERINWFTERVDEALIRYRSAISDRQSALRSQLRNPIIWLREGTRLLLALPFSLTGWLGIVSSGTTSAITLNPIFRAFAGLLAAIGFVASIFSIVSGWHDVKSLLDGWLQRL